jgi:nucleoside-diphosphate-sugar epimerase
MKILITGNMGYIGPSVVNQLRRSYPDAELVGMDLGFFAHCLTGAQILPESRLHQQIFADVRDITVDMLQDVYAVVHLAAISNDPMGQAFEQVTHDINCQASIKMAQCAKAAGVKRYVFASSCSVYGFAEGGPRQEGDELNPLTAYARSKVGTEEGIKDLASEGFVMTCLRFATACGMSERLRLDLVLNDFVACAVTSGRIQILSDGTPWRPLIHIQDMARAIDWGIQRDASNGGAGLIVNAGSNEWNYQVRDLAEGVLRVMPNVKLSMNKNAQPDKRSYRVDFTRFRALAPNYQPQIDLDEAVRGLKEGLEAMWFHAVDFRNSHLMRLKVLTSLREANLLSDNLTWTHSCASGRQVQQRVQELAGTPA